MTNQIPNVNTLEEIDRVHPSSENPLLALGLSMSAPWTTTWRIGEVVSGRISGSH